MYTNQRCTVSSFSLYHFVALICRILSTKLCCWASKPEVLLPLHPLPRLHNGFSICHPECFFFSFPNWEQPSEGVCGTLPWGVVARNPAIDDVSCTTWRLLLARLWVLRVGETAGFFALSSVSLNLLCSICSNYMEAPEITGRADRTTSLFIHSFNFQIN